MGLELGGYAEGKHLSGAKLLTCGGGACRGRSGSQGCKGKGSACDQPLEHLLIPQPVRAWRGPFGSLGPWGQRHMCWKLQPVPEYWKRKDLRIQTVRIQISAVGRLDASQETRQTSKRKTGKTGQVCSKRTKDRRAQPHCPQQRGHQQWPF